MKKTYSIAIIAFAMLFTPASTHTVKRMSGNGWSSATIKCNGKTYTYTNSMARSGNDLYDICRTDAYIMRRHKAVAAYFDTYSYGYVYGYGSETTATVCGNSYGDYAACPYGSGQVEKIISGSGTIIMYADSTNTSTISVHY